MELGAASERERLERVLRGGFDPMDVLPRLARLARVSATGSPNALFAERQLAELLACEHPWRAAIHARRVLVFAPEDDGAWAILGFCQLLLGNPRSAARAYRQAVARSPGNPAHLHRLGHVLDMALGRHGEAVRFLRAAHEARPRHLEILCSYAHALVRAGAADEARRLLADAVSRSPARALSALLAWAEDPGTPGARPRRRPALERALAGGLSRLPFDREARDRARRLARDAAGALPAPRSPRENAELAATVAFAMVYVDRMPLSATEVAAPFRVPVDAVRAGFTDLRARLDLLQGDARYGRQAIG